MFATLLIARFQPFDWNLRQSYFSCPCVDLIFKRACPERFLQVQDIWTAFEQHPQKVLYYHIGSPVSVVTPADKQLTLSLSDHVDDRGIAIVLRICQISHSENIRRLAWHAPDIKNRLRANHRFGEGLEFARERL